MNRLRHYVALTREIRQLDARIHALQEELDGMSPRSDPVADTVTRGKKGKKPLGVVKIEGSESYEAINRKRTELAVRLTLWRALKEEAEADVGEISKIISEIEDPDTRRIIGYYCLDGYSNWEAVAAEMGPGWSAGACRTRYYRYVKEVEDGGTD